MRRKTTSLELAQRRIDRHRALCRRNASHRFDSNRNCYVRREQPR